MMKKLLFSLLLCLLAVPLSAQQSEAEREAMYYIRKAYDYSRERKTEEALKYVKLFEIYLEKNLSPERSSDSIVMYYLSTLKGLISEQGEKEAARKLPSVNWKTVYLYAMRLSKEDNSLGLYSLGDYYYYYKKNYVEAINWYRKAANKGYASAQNSLGYMYRNGQGVSRDYLEALKWYRQAAEKGNLTATLNMGSMYYEGYGVTKDYVEAVKWYRKAAEQGEESAQVCLGIAYYKGHGVSEDYSEAVKWFRKSADQGDEYGQIWLGIMYAKGHGVSQDYTEAVKWLGKAVEQGNEEAKGYYEVLLQLTKVKK